MTVLDNSTIKLNRLITLYFYGENFYGEISDFCSYDHLGNTGHDVFN